MSAWPWEVSSQVVISRAFCNILIDQIEIDGILICAKVINKWDNKEGLLIILEIAGENAYVVTTVVPMTAVVVVAAVIVVAMVEMVAVVVVAMVVMVVVVVVVVVVMDAEVLVVVGLRFVVMVAVVKEASQCMSLLCTTANWFTNKNIFYKVVSSQVQLGCWCLPQLSMSNEVKQLIFLIFFRNAGWGFLYTWGVYLGLIPTLSSLYMTPSILSMVFSYLVTTFLLLPLFLPHLYLANRHIWLIVSVLCGGCSVHSCGS